MRCWRCVAGRWGRWSVSRRDSFRVYVHLDAEGGWLNGRPRLPGHLVAKLTCEGTVQPLWERAGVPVSVGRALRIVPERTRRLVLDRDRGCRFPGCVATAHLQVHHVVHWAHGGRTDLDNLVALCPFHHDAHHAGEFGIRVMPTFRAGWCSPPGAGSRSARARSTPRHHPRADGRDRDVRGRRPWSRDAATATTATTATPGRPGPRSTTAAISTTAATPTRTPSPSGRQDELWPGVAPPVAYPGATGEVLQGKWVTFREGQPVHGRSAARGARLAEPEPGQRSSWVPQLGSQRPPDRATHAGRVDGTAGAAP